MKKLIAILLCAALAAGLFAGCEMANTPEGYMPTGDALENAVIPQEEEAQEETNQMTLAYYADQSMNPLIAEDYSNRVIISLVYQGLFAVNRDYEPVPILCKNYSASTDLMTYEFTVDPEATFSDGITVKPEDVVASLKTAKANPYYSGRFRYIHDITVTESGTVLIQLTRANENLPLLLDVPIVKAAEVELEYPLGTGPYTLSRGIQKLTLKRRSDWWCTSTDLQMRQEQISLMAADSPAAIRDAFEFANVGVVCTDPGSDRYAEYRCDYELWECETGLFVYLGVNKESPVFQDDTVRRALTKGINRELLVEEYYRGFATAAELPASPNSPYYTQSLAKQYTYDPEAFLAATQSLQGQVITLLVNEDDSLRVRVAQEIARMLNTAGLIVEVEIRSSSEYRYFLSEKKYDLYLGQTKLSPNMDLSPFFSADGALTYGGLADVSMQTMCLQALENQGNVYTLHQSVMDNAYLCPVLFRSYAVYATRGLLTHLQPSRDNLFYYTLGRTLADAYLIRSNG